MGSVGLKRVLLAITATMMNELHIYCFLGPIEYVLI